MGKCPYCKKFELDGQNDTNRERHLESCLERHKEELQAAKKAKRDAPSICGFLQPRSPPPAMQARPLQAHQQQHHHHQLQHMQKVAKGVCAPRN